MFYPVQMAFLCPRHRSCGSQAASPTDSLCFSYRKLGALTILEDAEKASNWVAYAIAGSMGYGGHSAIPG